MSLQKQTTKSIVRKRKDSEKLSPKRLLQLSAAGEVFLEGTCPLSPCPQTAKFPAPYFWRTEKVGEKSDSFSRAERTRPLRPVSRLLFLSFGNVPVERFQRNFSLTKSINAAQLVAAIHKPQSPPSAQTRGFFIAEPQPVHPAAPLPLAHSRRSPTVHGGDTARTASPAGWNGCLRVRPTY